MGIEDNTNAWQLGVMGLLAVVMLCHSWYLHGKEWRMVRLACDVACAALLLHSIALAIHLKCRYEPTAQQTGSCDWFVGLLAYPIANGVIIASDLYLSYVRFVVLTYVDISSGGSPTAPWVVRVPVFLFMLFVIVNYVSPYFELDGGFYTKEIQTRFAVGYWKFTEYGYIAFHCLFFLLLVINLARQVRRLPPSVLRFYLYRVGVRAMIQHMIVMLECFFFNGQFFIPVLVLSLHVFLNDTHWDDSCLMWMHRRSEDGSDASDKAETYVQFDDDDIPRMRSMTQLEERDDQDPEVSSGTSYQRL
jgi:hypothetical protein